MLALKNDNQKGFTLIETIIYVGLFSIMFTGIFVSIYPFFTGAERLTRNILIEGETAFILSKIRYTLNDSVTSTEGRVIIPAAGQTDNKLVLENSSNETYRFEIDETNSFCTSPLNCSLMTLEIDANNDPKPLHASRVQIDNLEVTHTGQSGDTPRYLDISFTANGEPVGPVRYYLHF
jgi:type II secretory pathway pseudopilin PulG